MKTVFKYLLVIADTTTVRLPVGAQVLDIQEGPDYAHLWMWARVDEAQQFADRTFHICGTGHPVPEAAEFLATVHAHPFVWHVFTPGADR